MLHTKAKRQDKLMVEFGRGKTTTNAGCLGRGTGHILEVQPVGLSSTPVTGTQLVDYITPLL